MLFLFCFLWGEGWGSQQCGPGLSWTHCVGQIGFKLTVFQTHPSECWDWPQGSATMPSSHYFVHLFFKIKCIGITFFPVCNFFILSAYIFDSLTESRIFFGNFISFVFLHLRDLEAFWFSVLCNIFFPFSFSMNPQWCPWTYFLGELGGLLLSDNSSLPLAQF